MAELHRRKHHGAASYSLSAFKNFFTLDSQHLLLSLQQPAKCEALCDAWYHGIFMERGLFALYPTPKLEHQPFIYLSMALLRRSRQVVTTLSSSCLSVHPHGTTRLVQMDFRHILSNAEGYCEWKCVEKTQLLLISDNIWRPAVVTSVTVTICSNR
jgi:hypothetical protein